MSALDMAKQRLGGSGRFAALKQKLSAEPGVKNPGGLAAYIGRKKLGADRFQNLASAARRRAS